MVVFGAVGSDLGWPLISGSHGMTKLDGGGRYLLVLANKCSVAGIVCGGQCAHLYKSNQTNLELSISKFKLQF